MPATRPAEAAILLSMMVKGTQPVSSHLQAANACAAVVAAPLMRL